MAHSLFDQLLPRRSAALGLAKREKPNKGNSVTPALCRPSCRSVPVPFDGATDVRAARRALTARAQVHAYLTVAAPPSARCISLALRGVGAMVRAALSTAATASQRQRQPRLQERVPGS